MPTNILLILAICAALGSGMMGGLLFAFSNFVMTALAHQPPASGIRTMQAINRLAALNPETAVAADYWLTYLSAWIKWNHVRAFSSVMGSVFLILAIRQLQFSGC